jgi:hypothetical protein
MWILIQKDILLWLRVRQSVLVTILIPATLMLVAGLAGTIGQRLSVAVVNPAAQAPHMMSEIWDSTFFKPFLVEPAQAEAWLEQGQIVAVINIPPDFDRLAASGQPAYVDMTLHNLDEDTVKNFTLRLYDVVFRVNQHLIRAEAKRQPMLEVQERGLLPRAVTDMMYLATGILVFTAIYGGLANTALLVAREWNEDTIKELLVAPVHRFEFVMAKICTGWLETMLSVGVVFLLSVGLLGLKPTGNLFLLWFFLAVCVLMSAAAGALFGCVIRRVVPAVMLGIILSVQAWFVGGGFGPVPFTSPALQWIAWKLPSTYAIAAVQQLMHTSGTTNLGSYASVVGGSMLVVLALSLVACNRLLAARPLQEVGG